MHFLLLIYNHIYYVTHYILYYTTLHMFKGLVAMEGKHTSIREALCDPGPDLIVADEAHVIKDKNSKINKALEKVRTKRRIALTGSPLQNNLIGKIDIHICHIV